MRSDPPHSNRRLSLRELLLAAAIVPPGIWLVTAPGWTMGERWLAGLSFGAAVAVIAVARFSRPPLLVTIFLCGLLAGMGGFWFGCEGLLAYRAQLTNPSLEYEGVTAQLWILGGVYALLGFALSASGAGFYYAAMWLTSTSPRGMFALARRHPVRAGGVFAGLCAALCFAIGPAFFQDSAVWRPRVYLPLASSGKSVILPATNSRVSVSISLSFSHQGRYLALQWQSSNPWQQGAAVYDLSDCGALAPIDAANFPKIYDERWASFGEDCDQLVIGGGTLGLEVFDIPSGQRLMAISPATLRRRRRFETGIVKMVGPIQGSVLIRYVDGYKGVNDYVIDVATGLVRPFPPSQRWPREASGPFATYRGVHQADYRVEVEGGSERSDQDFWRTFWLQLPWAARLWDEGVGNRLVIIHRATSQTVFRSQPIPGKIYAVAFSHDGAVCAAVAQDGIYVFDVPKPYRPYPTHLSVAKIPN